MNNFVAIDIETSGLHPEEDSVIRIMATKVKDGVYEKFATFVNPCKKLIPEIVEFTGITNEDLEHAPKMEDIIGVLTSFCEGFPLVAYNAPFVQKFMKGYPAFADINDILEVFKDAFGGKTKRLKDLVELCGIPYDDKDDSETVAKIYIKIAK